MLAPENWPACWLYHLRGDISVQGNETKPNRIELGERTTMHLGALIYSCKCGSSFTRLPGFRIPEARAWVAEHAPHVSEEATTTHEGE